MDGIAHARRVAPAADREDTATMAASSSEAAAAAAAGSLQQLLNLDERLQECRATFKLNVGYAGLPQLPAGFVELVKQHNPNITELDLSSNNLTSLPDDMGELRALRVLRVKYNQLARMPSAISRLPVLGTLELSGNQIAKLDSSIGKMTALRELDLSGNLLRELPDALATLPRLEVLRLENNRLESLPESLGELPALLKLDVSTNCLRHLPASMGRLRRVQRIDAANNALMRVPPAMGHVKSLKALNLQYNSGLDPRYKAKAEEGLSRLLAFLREEEERERLEEIERLRPVGTPVGAYVEYKCKAEPAQLVRTEFGDVAVDNRCWLRSGHSLTQVGNLVYVFGGQLVRDGSVSNELFWMTSERMEWRCQPTRGDRPAGRHGHVCVYDPDHHQLVVFGGRNADRRRLADVAVLDLDSFTWRRPAVSGPAPSAREGAAAAYHAGHMALFGGHASSGRTNDLLLLELSGWTWSHPVTTGVAPSPRSGAVMCVAHGRYLAVHGGRNNFVLDSCHVLDLMTRAWAEVGAAGAAPPPRHGHVLHAANDDLWLFGGSDELGASTVGLFRATLPRGAVDRACKAAAAAAFGGAGGGGGTALAAAGSPDSGPAGAGSGGGGGSDGGSGAMLRLQWTRLDAELSYNRCRAAVMQAGQLRCYQLGSSTLGHACSDEDAEKGLAFWDVFKVAPLVAFKPLPVASDDAAAGSATAHAGGSSGKAGRVQHASHSAGKLPVSFTANSAKEARLLEYVDAWQRAFRELYPYRRPMPLAPLNECGVPKFLCTTLRPSLPPAPELYGLESAARCISELLAYEPLADPLHPPSHLPSPASVLAWQAADAFDAAVVLASLLLGAGFNAYAVFGYAPRAVTLNDQSGVECPPLLTAAGQQQQQAMAATAAGGRPGSAAAGSSSGSPLAASKAPSSGGSGSGSGAAGSSAGRAPSATGNGNGSSSGSGPGAASSGGSSAAAAASEPGSRQKYQVLPRPQLLSKFLQAHPEQQRPGTSAEEDGSRAADGTSKVPPRSEGLSPEEGRTGAAAGPDSTQEAAATDKHHGRRVHAWVLVLPGKREVTKPLFVEPSTGRLVIPASPECPYTGVEMVWSASNAWVCMQAPKPHSDSRAHPAAISWDLANSALWEPVLDDAQTRPVRVASAHPGSSHSGMPGSTSSAAMPGMASRAGLASSMMLAAAASSLAVGSGAGSGLRPHTPTLPRASTAAGLSSIGVGGAGAGLSRVASRVLVTGGGAVPVPAAAGARPDSSKTGAGGLSAETAAGTSSVAGRGPASEHARSEYARSEMGDSAAAAAADEAAAEAPVLPELPPSWVPRLTLPRDVLDMRCPRGSRATRYRRALHEIYAPFGECARWDGLVERLTRYGDDACTLVEELQEVFARRKDKLRERHTWPQQQTVEESFGPGSLFALRSLRIVRGQRRDIAFYGDARLDGLVARSEVFGVKLVEHFAGRDDRLVYRSATFGSTAPAASPAAEPTPGADAGAPAGSQQQAQPPPLPEGGRGAGAGLLQPLQLPLSPGDGPALGLSSPGNPAAAAGASLQAGSGGPLAPSPAHPLVKITQKFDRNPHTPAEQDVARQVFHLAAGATLVTMHTADTALTAGHLLFHRDGAAQAVQADPLVPAPSAAQLRETYRALQGAEKALRQAVRDAEWEGREIARARNAQEQAIALEAPYFDIARIQAEDSDDEPPDAEGPGFDYLLPFLPPGLALSGGGGELTREQALGVRERALRALKDRLIERAAIIQARLDEEAASLTRRQAAYARDRDARSAAEEEAHEAAAEEAAFRTSILHKRLARHEDAALAAYYALDKRLRSDPRLAALTRAI